jgi:GNAT superfamily N-acetyltransferase
VADLKSYADCEKKMTTTIPTSDSGNKGKTEVEVRLASVADALLLATFRWELRSAFHQVTENEATFKERCALWMQERLGSGGRWKCWIAEWQKTAVGNVWVQLVEKIPNPVSEPEYYVYLTNFYVREQYRDKGVGSALLSTALAWGSGNNIESIILWPTERSKPFYSRHGFLINEELMHRRIHE